MSFILQFKGFESSLDFKEKLKEKIQRDLGKVSSSLDEGPPDLSVYLTAEGGVGRFKCAIRWMPKRKHGVQVQKSCVGAYSTFRAALSALKEASRRQSGRRRKLLLGV